jgi:hypothetical protein
VLGCDSVEALQVDADAASLATGCLPRRDCDRSAIAMGEGEGDRPIVADAGKGRAARPSDDDDCRIRSDESTNGAASGQPRCLVVAIDGRLSRRPQLIGRRQRDSVGRICFGCLHAISRLMTHREGGASGLAYRSDGVRRWRTGIT